MAVDYVLEELMGKLGEWVLGRSQESGDKWPVAKAVSIRVRLSVSSLSAGMVSSYQPESRVPAATSTFIQISCNPLHAK